MEKEIEVNCCYRKGDAKKAMSFYLLRIKNMRVYVYITYPILLLVIIISLWCGFRDNIYFTLAASFLFVWLVMHYYYYLRPMQAYEKAYEKAYSKINEKTISYKFSKESVFISNENLQSTAQWAYFQKAHETPSAFLLLHERNVFILPKSCFDSVSDIDDLRELLKINGYVMKQY